MYLQTAENSAVGSESVNTAPAGVPAGISSGSVSGASTPITSGDGAAAVNTVSKTASAGTERGKRSDSSNEKTKDESGGSERVGYTEKPTPKSTSEAINRATERYRKRIEEFEQREKRLGELLKSAGLTVDLETAISQLKTNTRNITKEAAIRKQTAARDYEVLGNADADEIIKGGDIEAELKRLENKPISLRTRRDRQCYLRLMNEQQSRRDMAALGKLGVDVEKLKKDGAFTEFDNNLNPDIPVAERYELFKKYCVMKKSVKPPVSTSSRGSTPKREYFDSATIDGMSREEIAANLDAITRSMKSW